MTDRGPQLSEVEMCESTCWNRQVCHQEDKEASAGRASFVVAVDLKSGAMPFDHWVRRGTALLMSLDM